MGLEISSWLFEFIWLAGGMQTGIGVKSSSVHIPSSERSEWSGESFAPMVRSTVVVEH